MPTSPSTWSQKFTLPLPHGHGSVNPSEPRASASGNAAVLAREFLQVSTSRLLKKLFSLPLADARGSVTSAAAAPARAFPNRGCEGEEEELFPQPAKNRRKGSALLMVLWLTAALSAVGLAVANNVRAETERTETHVDDSRAYFVARGGVERAALHMLWGRQYLTPDGLPIYYVAGNPSMDLAFPAADVHVDIIPETSKLSLNASRPEDILRLLIALGTPEERATEITAAIVDWRTAVDPLHPSPFDSFYLSQSPSFIPRHTSFQENEELLLVKGMTPDLYYGSSLTDNRAGLRDCLSVYGTGGAVDINTAQPATLQAIGLAAADAETIVRSRVQHPVLDSREFGEIVQSLGPAGSRLRIGGVTMFTLRATARLRQPDGKLSNLRRTVGALVKIYFPGNPANKPPGFEVVRWFDRI
jgi:general secretion pathway protein K